MAVSPLLLSVSLDKQRSLLKVKRIVTPEPSPQYYRVTGHYETLRMLAGPDVLDQSLFTIVIFMMRLVLKPSFSYTRIAPTFSVRT